MADKGIEDLSPSEESAADLQGGRSRLPKPPQPTRPGDSPDYPSPGSPAGPGDPSGQP